MRRLVFCRWLLLTCIALCALVPASATRVQAGAAPDFVPGELLVRLQPNADVRAVARDHRLKAAPEAIEPLGTQPIYRLSIADGASPVDKASELALDARIIYAEPDYLGQAPEARQRSSWTVGDADEAVYLAQWAPDKIHLSEAHRITRGAGIVVAVLDTGADLTHSALATHLTGGFDFVDGDTDPSEVGAPGVDYAFGHGTHVAGLLALAAPEATIMPLRTLSPDGVGTVWAQVQALRFAIEHGADVVNLSWSFRTRSRVLDDVLAEVTCVTVVDAGCRTTVWPGAVVVAAAGNSGVSVLEYPAADTIPGMLAVAASTEADVLATFSTYGTWVPVAAPGERIVSSVPGGAYASWSGTSMSAPLSAGTVALIRVAYPAYKPAEIVSRIRTTAATIGGPVRRRIDAAAALRGSKLK
jgi:subtilisin family serine protease